MYKTMEPENYKSKTSFHGWSIIIFHIHIQIFFVTVGFGHFLAITVANV